MTIYFYQNKFLHRYYSKIMQTFYDLSFGATCSIFHPHAAKNAAIILQQILSVAPSTKIVAEI